VRPRGQGLCDPPTSGESGLSQRGKKKAAKTYPVLFLRKDGDTAASRHQRGEDGRRKTNIKIMLTNAQRAGTSKKFSTRTPRDSRPPPIDPRKNYSVAGRFREKGAMDCVAANSVGKAGHKSERTGNVRGRVKLTKQVKRVQEEESLRSVAVGPTKRRAPVFKGTKIRVDKQVSPSSENVGVPFPIQSGAIQRDGGKIQPSELSGTLWTLLSGIRKPGMNCARGKESRPGKH